MPRSKKARGEGEWVTFKLPAELIRLVEEVINEREMGYTTRPEFICDAIRHLLHHYGKIKFRPHREEGCR